MTNIFQTLFYFSLNTFSRLLGGYFSKKNSSKLFSDTTETPGITLSHLSLMGCHSALSDQLGFLRTLASVFGHA